MLAQRGSRTRGIVWQMLWVTTGVVAYGGFSAGCSSQQPSVMVQLPAAGDQPAQSFDLSSCPQYPHSTEMDRVCLIDSRAKVYPVGGPLVPVLAAAPPYAVLYQFKPGYAPALQDLDNVSNNPAIGVYAAPYDVYQAGTQHCCAEDDPANRIPSQVGLTPSGGLLVAVTKPQPASDQIAVMLSYDRLFRSRVSPCTLPSAEFCQSVSNGGFAERFYVGAGPTDAPTPPDAGPPPPGACLLEYNDALVSAGADTCCFHLGGANSCHTITQCNDASGPGCCLVYGTDNTAGGSRCCLYESGDFGDDPSECQMLLAAP